MEIHEIKSQIELIESLDANSTSIEEYKNLINPLLNNIFMTSPLIDKSTYLFRAVKLDKKAEKFTDIIYPPKHFLQSYQRLNKPKCPAFYCSTSKHCCVFEGRYKTGDLISISEWEVLDDKNLATVNIGYTDYLKKWTKEELPNWHKDEDKIKGKTSQEIDKNYLILDFMSKLFCQNFDNDNSKYKITIAISNIFSFDTESESVFEKIGEEHFKGENAFEALIYPSILTKAKADNLAIRRFTFHKKIKFVSAEYVRILSVDENDFSFEVIDFANEIDIDNNILWKGRPGKDIIPRGVEVKLQKLSDGNFSLSRNDGEKMYKS